MKQVRRSAERRDAAKAELIAKYTDGKTDEEKEVFISEIEGKNKAVKIPYASFDYIYRHIDEFGVIDKNGNIVLVNENAYKKIINRTKISNRNIGKKNDLDSNIKAPKNYFEINISEDGTVVERDYVNNSMHIKTEDGKEYIRKNDKIALISSKTPSSNGKGSIDSKKQSSGKYSSSANEKNLLEQISQQNKELQEAKTKQEKLLVLAYKDTLTRAFNRNKLNEDIEFIDLNNTIAAFVDGDKFKNVNDTYGHEAGDLVLQMLADKVFEQIREKQMRFYRIGGEEFLLVSQMGLESTLETLEDIRKSIQSSQVQYANNTIAITISTGVAIGANYSAFKDLVSDADFMVYKAKENGRNRIEIAHNAIPESEKNGKDKEVIDAEVEVICSPEDDKQNTNIQEVLPELPEVVEDQYNPQKALDEELIKLAHEEEEERERLDTQQHLSNATSNESTKSTESGNNSSSSCIDKIINQIDSIFLTDLLLGVMSTQSIDDKPVILQSDSGIYVDAVYFSSILIRLLECDNREELFLTIFKGKKSFYLDMNKTIEIVSKINATSFSSASYELINVWGDDNSFVSRKYFHANNGKLYSSNMIYFNLDAIESLNVDCSGVDNVEFLSKEDAEGALFMSKVIFGTLF